MLFACCGFEFLQSIKDMETIVKEMWTKILNFIKEEKVFREQWVAFSVLTVYLSRSKFFLI